jgi:hypothetical protein
MASAQTESYAWFASPFIGMTFSGDTAKNAPLYGVAGGWMGSRIGFEGEVADALRGDVRYMRTAGMSDSDANPFGLDLARFEFWRASAGLVVKF